MDKISELIQEAKPLYFERKKRKETLKKGLFIFVPFLLISMAIIPFTVNFSDKTSYYTSSTSIVEQMGFPTDDYGLLKAD